MVLSESLGLLLIGYWLSLCLARLHTECTVKIRWHQHISSRARKFRSAETSLRTCLRLKRGKVSEAKEVGLPVWYPEQVTRHFVRGLPDLVS